MSTVPENVIFRDALRFWFRLGLVSFGGPAGQIAIMQKELVDERGWISREDFLHALNFCMLLPGPEAQQLATYIGWKLHGFRGGVAAGTLFVVPSVFLLFLLSWIYAAWGAVPHIDAVFDGFKAVVLAIVFEALVRVAGRSLASLRHWIIAVAAFAAIFFVKIPFPLIVLAAATVGTIAIRSDPAIGVSRSRSFERGGTPILKLAAVFVVLWSVPFIALGSISGFGGLAAELYLFFTKAAFVTFGGAYAVLAYVNQEVVAAGWITAAQSVDGLALAETTPGPLIMVLQFIGFMTGWNATGRPGPALMLGALTTWVTFLPSFLFIFAGAPHVERLRENRPIRSALAGVSAAVVGVILNLALVFSGAVILGDAGPNLFALALAIAAFLALRFLKLDVLAVVVAGGALGLAKFLLVG
jgi:chromate transporter